MMMKRRRRGRLIRVVCSVWSEYTFSEVSGG
jgi:hypothetical protein